MAAERIFRVTGVTHGIAPVAGATHVGLAPAVTRIVDPGGAGSPGDAESLVTDLRLDVTLYGLSQETLLALLNATGDLAIGIIGPAGTAETITISDVRFVAPVQHFQAKAKDAGGPIPAAAIRGVVEWGESESFADVISAE